MKKRYVLYGHTISLLNKIIWLILDALMQKKCCKTTNYAKKHTNYANDIDLFAKICYNLDKRETLYL